MSSSITFRKLRSIDLFSGIGGMQYALRDISRPHFYCEIDAFCKSVLEKHMNSGALPRAPILNDVRHTRELLRVVRNKKIDLIVFTSSCKGFSRLYQGQSAGLDHEETKLFVDAMRIVKHVLPPIVFMENVPGIITSNNGDDYAYVHKTFNLLGYTLKDIVVAADEVGAPHLRRRWYAIAFHKNTDSKLIRRLRDHLTNNTTRFPSWGEHQEPQYHRVPRSTHDSMRLRALGNAVVPKCAMHAFKTLLGVPTERIHKVHRTLVLDPKLGRMKRTSAAKSKPLTKKVTRFAFPTPRAHSMYSCNQLTLRCTRELPTFIRFWEGMRGDRFDGVINAQFVEYLMGFPKDWTVT